MILIYLSISIVSLASLFFIAFSTFFITNRTLLNREYKLKEKFNYHMNNPIGANLKSLQSLVENNKDLSPIYDFFVESNKKYMEQVKIIKMQLFDVSKKQKGFQFKSSYKSLKLIQNNILKLEKQEINFKSFTLDTEIYSNNSNSLSVDIFDLISMISIFGKESNVILEYENDSSVFKILNDKINFNSKEINNQLLYINSQELHSNFVKQIIEVEKFYNVTRNFYFFDRHKNFLNSLIFEMNELKKENDKLLNPKIILNLDKVISNTKNVIYSSRKKAIKLNFADAQNDLRDSIIQLENIKLDIKLESSYKEIFDRYFETFKSNIKHYYSSLKENNLKDIYTNILSNFSKDNSINELTYNNIELINSINKEITSLNKELIIGVLSSSQYFNKIIKIYELIIILKNENDNLLKLIKEKTNIFLKITFKISDCDIKLVHLIKIVNSLKNNNNEIIISLNQNLKLLSEVKEIVFKDMNNIDQRLEQKIISIENFITQIVEQVYNILALDEIYKRLKLYSNRYYDDSTKKSINDINRLYKENKFYEAIESYTNFIIKNKKQKRTS